MKELDAVRTLVDMNGPLLEALELIREAGELLTYKNPFLCPDASLKMQQAQGKILNALDGIPSDTGDLNVAASKCIHALLEGRGGIKDLKAAIKMLEDRQEQSTDDALEAMKSRNKELEAKVAEYEAVAFRAEHQAKQCRFAVLLATEEIDMLRRRLNGHEEIPQTPG